MCDNPRLIRNNRLDYRRDLHPSTIIVPCLECPSCVALRRNDYALRSKAEARLYSTSIMVLFTYAPSRVPTMTYDGETDMCFNSEHISELLRILRRFYKGAFSYLIGAEYAVNPDYTERPHYHAVFHLASSIDPQKFYEFVIRIWTGRAYYRDQYQSFVWKYGNLGLVLPFVNDSKHPFICKDKEASAAYAAKYATKQVGFFSGRLWSKIARDGKQHDYWHSRPRVFVPRGFGKDILNYKSFDPVKRTYIDNDGTPNAKEVSVPKAVMDMFLYERIYNGRTSKVYDKDTHQNYDIVKFDPKTKIPYLLKSNERKLYDRFRREDTLQYDLPRLDMLIRIYSDKCRLANIDNPFLTAVYHYVYRGYPYSAFDHVCDDLGVVDYDKSIFTNHEFYHRFFMLTHVKICKHYDRKPTFDRSDTYTYHNITGVETMDSFIDMFYKDLPLHDQEFVDLCHEVSKEVNKLRVEKQDNVDKLRHFLDPHLQ